MLKNSWTKKDIKNRLQCIGDKTTCERSVPKFKSAAVRKLKGKEYFENENRELANTMQLSSFDGNLNQPFHWSWIISYGFYQKIRLRMNFKEKPKSSSEVHFLTLLW